VVVAGSTWPDDEAVLIPALAGLRGEGIRFRLVLAPHDTAEGRLRHAECGLEAAGFAHGRWSRGGETDEAILVDRVGVLRALYAGAAVAWVGGGFRGALHNVMEPAARRVAVVIGPGTRRSWVAASLERAGGLFRVASVPEAAAVLRRLLSSRAAAADAGMRARSALEAHAGATRRTVAALEAAGWLPQPETGAAAAR
jgi:3-deoxy-D-manno-octulosonic-acid transferase